jgi:hypothetical protein
LTIGKPAVLLIPAFSRANIASDRLVMKKIVAAMVVALVRKLPEPDAPNTV